MTTVDTKVDFGKALKALKDGKMVVRESWRQDTFLFMQVPADINVEQVVPKMQSLPQSVKNEFLKRVNDLKALPSYPPVHSDVTEMVETIRYKNQLAIVNGRNEIYGYSPSAEDVLAEDWVILN